MAEWRIQTESGSIYIVRKIGSEWRLEVPTAPNSARAIDLRGSLVSIVEPIPWPPQVGRGMLILMEWAPGHVKVRGTTAVVRIDGPPFATAAGGEEA